MLLEQNPKIEIISPTKTPMRLAEDNGEIDDLNFHLSKRKHKNGTLKHQHGSTPMPGLQSTTEYLRKLTFS